MVNYMCESKAVLIRNGKEEVLMENVVYLSPGADAVVLRDITGSEKRVEKVRLKYIDFLKHVIYFESAE